MKPLFTDFNCDSWFVLLMLIKEVCITWRARSVSDVHLAVPQLALHPWQRWWYKSLHSPKISISDYIELWQERQQKGKYFI